MPPRSRGECPLLELFFVALVKGFGFFLLFTVRRSILGNVIVLFLELVALIFFLFLCDRFFLDLEIFEVGRFAANAGAADLHVGIRRAHCTANRSRDDRFGVVDLFLFLFFLFGVGGFGFGDFTG